MNTTPLVSILIPTYNRAGLIAETLDSIIAQTYVNWECIIVDDGSTDHTSEVVELYIKNDRRFQYHRRPENLPKGANSCRNYGFEKSIGEYIIWFDSDDLMLPQKLHKQVLTLQNGPYDFCVARFEDFSDVDYSHSEPVVVNEPGVEINATNYVTGKIFWGTIDLIGNRAIFLNCYFNNRLRSGQEYHFFVSVLSSTAPTGVFLDEVLSMRRVHANSIQQVQKKDYHQWLQNKFDVYWITYNDFSHRLSREAIIFLLQKCILYYHKLSLNNLRPIPLSKFIKMMRNHLNAVQLAKIVAILVTGLLTSKGDLVGSVLIKKIVK